MGGEGIAEDASGNLYIANPNLNCVYKVVFQGPNLLLTNLTAGFDGNYDVIVTGSQGSVTSQMFAITSVLSPQNLSASLSPGIGAQVQFTGSPVTSYVLLSATNLTPPINWQIVSTNYTDGNGNWTFTDTNALTNTATFYRAMVP